jgi:hypothetical protein
MKYFDVYGIEVETLHFHSLDQCGEYIDITFI